MLARNRLQPSFFGVGKIANLPISNLFEPTIALLKCTNCPKGTANFRFIVQRIIRLAEMPGTQKTKLSNAAHYLIGRNPIQLTN